MGLKTWKKWTDWPLMVLSVVFLVVYSWEILSRTHIALCETVINVIWVVFVVDYVVSLWLADDRWQWFKHNLFTLLKKVTADDTLYNELFMAKDKENVIQAFANTAVRVQILVRTRWRNEQ